MKGSIITVLLVFFIAFLLAFAVMPAFAGDLSYTFDPPTTRTDGKPLSADEISHYNGVVRQLSDQSESTFTVPGTDTGFTLPNLVAGDYCVKLSTTDTEGRTDGFSNEVCKTVPEGPLQPPSPPVLHSDVPPVSFDVPADDWTVVYADSYESDNWLMPPECAFNRDTQCSTQGDIWHTQYTPTTDPLPHEIQIDMGQVYTVVGFSQKPREGGGNGTVKEYAFSLSLDGTAWTQAAGGEFSPGEDLQTVVIPATPARFFKLVALSSQAGEQVTSVDEIYIQAI